MKNDYIGCDIRDYGYYSADLNHRLGKIVRPSIHDNLFLHLSLTFVLRSIVVNFKHLNY